MVVRWSVQQMGRICARHIHMQSIFSCNSLSHKSNIDLEHSNLFMTIYQMI